jgi:hypothetical protein
MDPTEYAPILEACVQSLFVRQMNVSLYNLHLCTLPRPLWWFARKSISDYKNIYVEECVACEAKALPCGFALDRTSIAVYVGPARAARKGRAQLRATKIPNIRSAWAGDKNIDQAAR